MTGTDSKKKRNGDLTVGVVEGFYGMPWSADQRKILFGWMGKMGLNTYMYAPKDDCKHRAHWRDLYSVEEADSLSSLIENAHERGVTFIYAISPGLDISFSNSKDVLALKRKLEQVGTFGCKSFALLFDDIEPVLSEADRSIFSSFASAQVSVANEVFEYLDQPRFFFCPTEYCTSRSVPNVHSSGYLNTIGTKLLPGIDIMWTGCKVVSKKITIQTLEDISNVLKRAPVLWDNIHANDYDPRRVYLGPYDGRSSDIIPYIRGVLTNPNCEFENNYIACHTLGQWCRSNPFGVKKDIILNERMSPVAADIKLEAESDFGSDDDLTCQNDSSYRPKQALKIAMKEWLEEFSVPRHPPKRHPMMPLNCAPPGIPTGILPTLPPPPFPPVFKSLPPVSIPVPDILKTYTVSTLTSITPSTATSNSSSQMDVLPSLPVLSVPNTLIPCPNPAVILSNFAYHQPLTQPVNALVEVASSTDLCSISDSGMEAEAMDCIPCSSGGMPANSPGIPTNKGHSTESKEHSTESLMQVEVCDKPVSTASVHTFDTMTVEDISLVVDLFYLPFEYGTKALQFLQSLHWIIENLHCVTPAKRDSEEFSKFGTCEIDYFDVEIDSLYIKQCKEWMEKATDFEKMVKATDRLLKRLFYSLNKSLLCSLHSYIWDLKGTLAVCLAFIKWLKHGMIPNYSLLNTTKVTTWFSEGYKEAFMSGDMEPWFFRGGLQHELQRLLPIATTHDLFFIKPPDIIVPQTASFRPFIMADEGQVYDICLKTCDDGMDGTDVFPENPKLIGDRLVGRFLALSPELCFVVEDDQGVFGYVVAARDARDLVVRGQTLWTPSMCQKYPKPLKEDISPAEEVMMSFHESVPELGEEVYRCYPSVLRLDILANRMSDPAVPRRLLACVLCALKALGSYGVHTELHAGDKYMADSYSKLGFFAVGTDPDTSSHDNIYMGRLI